jgi:hypothetical protein
MVEAYKVGNMDFQHTLGDIAFEEDTFVVVVAVAVVVVEHVSCYYPFDCYKNFLDFFSIYHYLSHPIETFSTYKINLFLSLLLLNRAAKLLLLFYLQEDLFFCIIIV